MRQRVEAEEILPRRYVVDLQTEMTSKGRGASVGLLGRFGKRREATYRSGWRFLERGCGVINSARAIPYVLQKGSVGSHIGFRFLSGFLYCSISF